MARTTLTVDGHTLLDADLTQWQDKPPPGWQELTHPTEPQPWSKPAMLLITEAILTNTPTDINVKTNGNDWWMRVRTN